MKSLLFIVASAALLFVTSTKAENNNNKLLRFPIKPTNNQKRLHKRDISGAPLYNANGKEYLVEVGVGSPPQFFNLTLDTGR